MPFRYSRALAIDQAGLVACSHLSENKIYQNIFITGDQNDFSTPLVPLSNEILSAQLPSAQQTKVRNHNLQNRSRS